MLKSNFLSEKIKNNQKIQEFRAKYGYLVYAFLIPAAIMLFIYICLGHKPLGDTSVLVLDLNAQYVYFYEALRDAVWGDGSLLYSFSRSLGGEYMGIYAYYTASPLSYIVALFPKSMMLYALLLMIVIKIGLMGASFGFYLHTQTKEINKINVIIFSTMYALCAYAITYQNNIMWMDALILLPILTYSIERLIKKGRYKLFVATLALILMSHYYIGYMLCFYTLFCFFFTYFKDSDRSLINPNGIKHHFVKSLTKIALSSVLSIGISAFMIGCAYYSLQFGKNTFSEPDFSFETRFDLLDLFPKMLPGSYDTVMHEGIPNLYSGVLTLFMLPVYFLAKKVDQREKLFYSSFVFLYILMMVINPTDLAMHGFQMPNCLNYRYSFIVSFLLLVMAYKGFCEIGEHSKKIIFSTGAVLIILLLIAQKFSYPNFTLEDNEYFKYGYVHNKLPFLQVICFSIIAIVAIGAAARYVIHADNKKIASRIMLAVVCIEMFANGIILLVSLGCDVGFSTYSSYADYFKELRPVVEMVKDQDDGFYRMEKTTHRCTNDNMALDINGLSNSTSTLNQKVIDLLDYLGFSADAHWTQYIGATAVTNSIFGVKYIVSNTQNEHNKESLAHNAFMDEYFEKVAEDQYYYAYKNPYALSLAFGVSDLLTTLDLPYEYDYKTQDGYKNPFEVQNVILNAMLGNDEENFVDFFTPILLTKNKNMQGSLGSVGGGMEYSSTATDIEEQTITFKFDVLKSGPLYLFMPTGYERAFTLFVNNEMYVSTDDNSKILFLGERQEGEEMKITFQLDEGNFYFFKHTNYLYTLDMRAFEDAFNSLSHTNMLIDEKSSESKIVGTITTSNENQTIMTTIPYDKGWKVKVDGQAVETYSVLGDALMAFDVDSIGEHKIEMVYMPTIYVVTGVISAISVLIFALLIFIPKKNKVVEIEVTDDVAADEAIDKTEGEN